MAHCSGGSCEAEAGRWRTQAGDHREVCRAGEEQHHPDEEEGEDLWLEPGSCSAVHPCCSGQGLVFVCVTCLHRLQVAKTNPHFFPGGHLFSNPSFALLKAYPPQTPKTCKVVKKKLIELQRLLLRSGTQGEGQAPATAPATPHRAPRQREGQGEGQHQRQHR